MIHLLAPRSQWGPLVWCGARNPRHYTRHAGVVTCVVCLMRREELSCRADF